MTCRMPSLRARQLAPSCQNDSFPSYDPGEDLMNGTEYWLEEEYLGQLGDEEFHPEQMEG